MRLATQHPMLSDVVIISSWCKLRLRSLTRRQKDYKGPGSELKSSEHRDSVRVFLIPSCTMAMHYYVESSVGFLKYHDRQGRLSPCY